MITLLGWSQLDARWEKACFQTSISTTTTWYPSAANTTSPLSPFCRSSYQNHQLGYQILNSRSEYRQYYFPNKIIDWNNLPGEVASAATAARIFPLPAAINQLLFCVWFFPPPGHPCKMMELQSDKVGHSTEEDKTEKNGLQGMDVVDVLGSVGVLGTEAACFQGEAGQMLYFTMLCLWLRLCWSSGFWWAGPGAGLLWWQLVGQAYITWC